MGARFRSWWQQIKQHRVAIGVGAIVLMVVIALIIIGYQFDWTGFNVDTVSVKSNAAVGNTLPTNITVYLPSKTLYDWMQLLIIPFVIAVAGYVINITISRGEQEATEQRDKTERYIELDRQHEATLKEYIDKMSGLILHEKLCDSAKGDDVRRIADIWTGLTLSRLDAKRKRHLVDFLRLSKLIEANNIVDLRNERLNEVDLSHKNLSGLNFSGAFMNEANLANADLSKSNFREVDLEGANLSNAKLIGADFSFAYLSDAIVSSEQLDKAKSLKGATMPDGSTHP